MSHRTDGASSDKCKILNVFNKHSKTTQKNCSHVDSLTANCKCLKHHKCSHGKYKMKRLKSCKQRSMMRGGGKEVSSAKSHHHHHRHQSSKDTAHFHSCCHSRCYCPSMRDAPFPNIIPVTQEPSIITGNRLIGHHGLFNHEVKSIDIERLLSEQRKQQKSEQVPERNHFMLHQSSLSHSPSPFSSKDSFCADSSEVVPFVKKADPATNIHDCCEKEKKISQGSDNSGVRHGQRPWQELDPSPGSYESIFSSKDSSVEVEIIKAKKTNYVMVEKGKESRLSTTHDRDTVKTKRKNKQETNKKLKTQMTSTLEQTPEIQDPLIKQTHAPGLSPSPFKRSNSSITESSDTQHRRQDTSCVSKSINEVATRLCDCLHFPFLRRRNLVTETREVLLRALQERHGSRLQENLLNVQRPLSFGADGYVRFPADASAGQADSATELRLDPNRTPSLHMKGNWHFNWSSQPHKSLERTAEWLTDPIDTSASPLDGILRPSCSPEFCMDSEPPEASAIHHLFSSSASPCWAEKSSASQHWEDNFNRPKSKKSSVFGSSKNYFLNISRVVRESCGPQYNSSNTHPFIPYPAQLPDKHSAESMHFSQEPDPFVTDKYPFGSLFSAHINHPTQSNQFQTFRQFSHPSFRSHNTDMMHYPPSHMLEREPAPPSSSLLSPEHWSFPPMRLY